MGTIDKGILGGFSGKVGPVVGVCRKKKSYIRALAARVSNPRTAEQQGQRGRFAVACAFLQAVKPFVRVGYGELAHEKPAFSLAMSYLLRRAVTGSGGEAAVDFDRALLSMGTLMPIFEGRATADDRRMEFGWQDNSGTGNADGSDVALVLVYNRSRQMAVYDTAAGRRSDGRAVLRLPEGWHTEELVAYLGFSSADGGCVANSRRLPVVPGKGVD